VKGFWITFIFLTVALAKSYSQGTITFDGSPIIAPGTAIFVQQYFESNMWFKPIEMGPGHGFVRAGDPLAGGAASRPSDGTAYVQGLGDSITFSFVDRSVFNLQFVDLAEYSSVVPATPVRFIGYRSDGITITIDIILDGIIDGAGPLADFQTFSFGSEWSGLTRVEMPYDGWSMDNLVVSIPEPSSFTLIVIGGTLFVRYFRRKLS
jgi:hypothetical protein